MHRPSLSHKHHNPGGMDSQPAVDTTGREHPDDVQMGVIVVPLLLSMFLVAVVLAYRCRAHRLRKDRLAREEEQELEEMKGEWPYYGPVSQSARSFLQAVSCFLPSNVRHVVAGSCSRFTAVTP